MKIFIKILTLYLVLITSACGQTKSVAPINLENVRISPGFVIQYIGNEGVLISDGKKQVLIDGLHREYKPAYLFPPPDLLKLMETAAPPYNQINLLLVSH